MRDISMIIKNYPSISNVFTQEWFEDEIKKDKKEMHLLAKQFTFKEKDGSSLDCHSLHYIGYLEMLLKNMKDEINSEREHFFKRLTDKNDYLGALAEIEIGYLFKNMGVTHFEFEPSIPGTNKTSDIKFVSDEGLEVFTEVFTRIGPETEEIHIFSWDDIPGNDNDKLIYYLEQIYDVVLEETGNIEKIDNGSTIKISAEKNSILLKLNDEKNKVTLKIDDVRTNEFIAKIGMENDKQNDKRNVFENPARIGKIKSRQPSDFREKIENESKQLSESNPGIIALYLEPSSIPEWRNVIKGFLNNVWDKNGNVIEIVDFSIVSAFLIYIRSFSNNKYNVFRKLCLNPRANYQLPDSITKKFEESEIIYPRSYDEFFSNSHLSE